MYQLPETITLAMRCLKVTGSNGVEIFDSLMAKDVNTAGYTAMILVEDVIGLQTGCARSSTCRPVDLRRQSILVPDKTDNIQSMVTPALTDHVNLVGDGVDVERGTHELTSRMTGMALKVRTY